MKSNLKKEKRIHPKNYRSKQKKKLNLITLRVKKVKESLADKNLSWKEKENLTWLGLDRERYQGFVNKAWI